MFFPLIWFIAGLAVLVGGGEVLVRGASALAVAARIRPLIIGLTVVAFGTSTPELAVSIQAAFAGQADVAVGNIVGSNLFNILCVLGLSSIVTSEGIGVSPTAVQFDIPVMIAAAVACLPIFFTGNLISRWEGGLFFSYYAAYTTYLVLATTQAGINRTFGVIMLAFVIPPTAITLALSVFRALRARNMEGPKGGPARGDVT